jgi:hypothetical protein
VLMEATLLVAWYQAEPILPFDDAARHQLEALDWDRVSCSRGGQLPAPSMKGSPQASADLIMKVARSVPRGHGDDGLTHPAVTLNDGGYRQA